MKKVLVAGYYGANNVGDELLASVILSWLRAADYLPMLVSLDPASSRAIHGVAAIHRHDLSSLAQNLADSHALVMGGGGLFQEHHPFSPADLYRYPARTNAEYAQLCLLARQFGKRVIALAQGVGPLFTTRAQDVVAQVYENASLVTVRDTGSLKLLAEFAPEISAALAPDPVWSIACAHSQRSTEPVLGVIVREWSIAPGWIDALSDALRSASGKGWRFRFVNMGGPADSEVISRVKVKAGLENADDHEAYQRPLEFKSAFDGCSAVLSMRLHGIITAALCGLPVAALSYDPKVSFAARELGLSDKALLELDAPRERYDAAIDWLAGSGPPSRDKVDDLAKRALVHNDQLLEALRRQSTHSEPARWRAGEFDWFGAWSSAALREIITMDSQAKREQQARESPLLRGLADATTEVRRLTVRINDALLRTSDADARASQAERRAARAEAEAALVEQKRQTADQFAVDAKARASQAEQRALDAEARASQAEQHALDAETRLAQAETLRNNWEYKALALEASTSWRVTKPLRTLSMLRRIAADGPIAPRVARIGAYGRKLGWRAAAGVIAKKLQSSELQSAAPSPSTLDNLAERVAVFAEDRKVAVVPCAFEFDELVNQRPINLSKHLAAKGYRVLFVAWQWSANSQLARASGEVYPSVMQIGLYEFLALQPRIQCRNRESLFFITFPAEQVVRAARAAREKQFRLIYDILDDWAEFKLVGQAPWYTEALEHQAVLEADLVTAVSPPLADKFASLRSDIVVVRNGFNPATIGEGSRNVAGSVATPTHRLVAGYFGHLTDAWFDWELVLACARSNSDVLFELIGYGAPDHILDEARRFPNISLVQATHPSKLRNFVCRWNVGLIPFKPGPLAHAVDPIKIYEYLYMGLPVVVTGISHLASYPGTIVLEERSSAAFGAAIRAHAAKAKDKAAEQDLFEFLLGSTWEARFSLMLDHVETAPHLGLLHD